MDKPIPVKKILHGSKTPAERVLQHGQYLHRIEKLLGSVFDDGLMLQCRVGNVRDGILIIYCNSTAWATRLRYQTSRILNALKEQYSIEDIRKIEVRISPVEEHTPPHQRVALSNEAADCITACANSVTDKGLQAALLRLADRQGKKT